MVLQMVHTVNRVVLNRFCAIIRVNRARMVAMLIMKLATKSMIYGMAIPHHRHKPIVSKCQPSFLSCHPHRHPPFRRRIICLAVHIETKLFCVLFFSLKFLPSPVRIDKMSPQRFDQLKCKNFETKTFIRFRSVSLLFRVKRFMLDISA